MWLTWRGHSGVHPNNTHTRTHTQTHMPMYLHMYTCVHTNTYTHEHTCTHKHMQDTCVCAHTHTDAYLGRAERGRPAPEGWWQQAAPPRLQTAPPHPGLGGAADVAASITWRAGCMGSLAHQPSGEPRLRGLQRGVENGEGSAVLMTAACTPRAARANSIAL